MKTLKRLLTVVLAFVMSLTVAVFSACNFTSGNNGDNGDKGNNGESGDNGNNGGNGGDDVTAEYVGSTEEITALVNAMLTQKVEYAGMTESVAIKSKGNRYRINSAGQTISEMSSYDDNDNSGLSGNFNLKAGDGDIVITSESVVPDLEQSYNRYSYTLLRDWNAFSYSEMDPETGASVKVTDFKGKTLYWNGKITDLMSDAGVPDINAIFNTTSLGELAGSIIVPAYGASIAAFADQLGAFTIEGNKATADLNKAAYNLVQKVTAVLDKIDENTKVGDLLALEEVKDLITALTTGLTGAQIKEYATQIIDVVCSIPMFENGGTLSQMLTALNVDVSKLFVEPAEGDTAYDYIVKLISSNELYKFINDVLKAVQLMNNPTATSLITLPSNVNEIKLNWFLDFAGIDVAKIKSLVSSYTEGTNETTLKINQSSNVIKVSYHTSDPETGEDVEEIITVNSRTHNYVTASNMKVEYTLDGNRVVSQKISTNESRTFRESNYSSISNHKVDYVEMDEGSESVSITATLNYPAEAYELADISSNPVIYSRGEWLADKTYTDDVNIYIYRELFSDLGIAEEYEGVEVAEYIATANIVNGVYKGFELSDEQGNKVTVGENSFQISVKPYKYGDDGREYGTPVNVTVDMKKSEYNSAYVELLINNRYCTSINFSQDTVYYQNTVSKLLVGGHASSTKFDPMAG